VSAGTEGDGSNGGEQGEDVFHRTDLSGGLAVERVKFRPEKHISRLQPAKAKDGW
jgi:hypothetical protein